MQHSQLVGEVEALHLAGQAEGGARVVEGAQGGARRRAGAQAQADAVCDDVARRLAQAVLDRQSGGAERRHAVDAARLPRGDGDRDRGAERVAGQVQRPGVLADEPRRPVDVRGEAALRLAEAGLLRAQPARRQAGDVHVGRDRPAAQEDAGRRRRGRVGIGAGVGERSRGAAERLHTRDSPAGRRRLVCLATWRPSS